MLLDARAIQTRRKWHLRLLLLAAVALAVSTMVSTSDTWVDRIAPGPDLYAILFDELARQHYLSTTTTTIVKEQDNTFELFERRYALRNQKLNLPQSRVTEPVDALANFSYVPGGNGLTEVPLEQVLWQHKNPTIQFTEPSGPPEVVWFYSKRERLLVVFCYEMIEQESVSDPLGKPDPRVIETIDWFGAVATHGYVPYRKGVAVHAYLLPFGT